jgi:hypothetical protein
MCIYDSNNKILILYIASQTDYKSWGNSVLFNILVETGKPVYYSTRTKNLLAYEFQIFQQQNILWKNC